MEYGALLQTLAGLGMDGTLPPAVPDSYESNEEFLRALHHVLMEARRAARPSLRRPTRPIARLMADALLTCRWR